MIIANQIQQSAHGKFRLSQEVREELLGIFERNEGFELLVRYVLIVRNDAFRAGCEGLFHCESEEGDCIAALRRQEIYINRLIPRYVPNLEASAIAKEIAKKKFPNFEVAAAHEAENVKVGLEIVGEYEPAVCLGDDSNFYHHATLATPTDLVNSKPRI